MNDRIREMGKLVGSLLLMFVGASWFLGRVLSDTSTFVPLPVAVIVMLGGFLGTYFATWNLSNANEKPVWKAVSLAVPVTLLSVFGFVWHQSQSSDYADYPEPEVKSETVGLVEWESSGEAGLTTAPEAESATNESYERQKRESELREALRRQSEADALTSESLEGLDREDPDPN